MLEDPEKCDGDLSNASKYKLRPRKTDEHGTSRWLSIRMLGSSSVEEEKMV